MAELIYKICDRSLWCEACKAGRFDGMPVDRADGYIHMSTAEQVGDTAARHFFGAADLVLIAYDPDGLGDRLKWEPARGGALFPHVYGTLDPALALWARPLPLGAGGRHVIPDLAA